jgi:hypothetical protein
MTKRKRQPETSPVMASVEAAAAPARPARRRSTRSPRASRSATVNTDVLTYNASQVNETRAVCDALAGHVSTALGRAEGRIWHGHPVWFLEGNPVVGYSTHREGTRVLFWSGQSFDEPGLSPVGKFKAAEARYAAVTDINAQALRRWLRKARTIQWDYKNVVKNQGRLERLR